MEQESEEESKKRQRLSNTQDYCHGCGTVLLTIDNTHKCWWVLRQEQENQER
jgi:hypothetical protein